MVFNWFSIHYFKVNYNYVEFLDLNLWSENNWTSYGKQFNKLKNFPLPGQIGSASLRIHENQHDIQQKKLKKIEVSMPHQTQLNLIMQTYFNTTNQQSKKESIGDINKHLELKSYKCPLSLLKGMQIIKTFGNKSIIISKRIF